MYCDQTDVRVSTETSEVLLQKSSVLRPDADQTIGDAITVGSNNLMLVLFILTA